MTTGEDGGADPSACRQTDTDPKNCGTCGNDCAALPHVRAGAPVSCVAGKCMVPAASCDDGYAHCTNNPDEICETALDRPESCGACGNTCPAATPLCMRVQDRFSCASACGSGTPDKCSSTCVDLKTDVGNCGTCGNDCRALPNGAGATCEAGVCKITKCRDGFGDCTSDSGCETSLTSNDSHCGACGTSCSVANGAATCTQGRCSEPVCAAGFGNCDKATPDCETPVSTARNCGACGVTCEDATPVCASVGGKYTCVSDCAANAPDKCGTSCVNLKTDAERCGACTTRCSFANAAASCSDGKCRMGTCNAGFADCNNNPNDGCETSLDSNTNCGRCGNACSFANAASSCVNKACTTPTCNAGFGNCDTASADCETQLNSNGHCGRCGRACPASEPICSTATGSAQCTTGCTASAPNRCGSSCTDVQSDNNHCGACDNACAGSCQGGTCFGVWNQSSWNGRAVFAP